MNFLYGQKNFRHISVCLGDLPSISVNILCGHDTLPQRPADHPITSVIFPCGRDTFRQLPSNFCAARTPFDNHCQLSVRRESFRQISSNFRVVGRPSILSINFSCCLKTLHQLFFCVWDTFCHLPSIFCDFTKVDGRSPGLTES